MTGKDNPSIVVANPASISSHSEQAPYYKFRVPYSSKMFADLSNYLRLGSNSVIMDAGCGTGHVTEKLVVHAQHIHSVDGSKEMVHFAKKFTNVTYRVADLNSEKFLVPNGVDHIFFGRSVHHFPSDSISTLVGNNLRENGAIVTCSSEWFPEGQWGEAYFDLKNKYEEDANTNSIKVDITGNANLPNIGFFPDKKFVDSFGALVDIGYLSRLNLARAYGKTLKNLQENFKDFEKEMLQSHSPFLVDGRLRMTIRSWAFVWKPNGASRR